MDTIINDTTEANKALNVSIALSALWAAICVYFAYTAGSAYEMSIAYACAAYHARSIGNAMRWKRYMRKQLAWIKRYKTTYPVPEPKSVSLRSLWYAICPL